MAAFTSGVSRLLSDLTANSLKSCLYNQNILLISRRNNFTFKHMAVPGNLNEKDYEYEITNDPKDWVHVEKLLPLVSVPVPKPKSQYPSGWRPMKEEALKLPYFVERTKNHMLPVHLIIHPVHLHKKTKLNRIHGQLWTLYDELNIYLYEQLNRTIGSFVHEGNNTIYYTGDYVYFIEQWLLSKGF